MPTLMKVVGVEQRRVQLHEVDSEVVVVAEVVVEVVTKVSSRSRTHSRCLGSTSLKAEITTHPCTQSHSEAAAVAEEAVSEVEEAVTAAEPHRDRPTWVTPTLPLPHWSMMRPFLPSRKSL
jgi:hypothetical protein